MTRLRELAGVKCVEVNIQVYSLIGFRLQRIYSSYGIIPMSVNTTMPYKLPGNILANQVENSDRKTYVMQYIFSKAAQAALLKMHSSRDTYLLILSRIALKNDRLKSCGDLLPAM